MRVDLFLHQQGLDTTTPAGKAMFQMMGVFAEFERSMIQERVRAGLKRARGEDKRLGRPPISPELENRIREALNEPRRTDGVRKIADRFGVNPGRVQRISRPFEASVGALGSAEPCLALPCLALISARRCLSLAASKANPQVGFLFGISASKATGTLTTYK